MTAFEFLAKALWWVGWWVDIISYNKYKLKQILNGVLWQRDSPPYHTLLKYLNILKTHINIVI